MLQRYLGKGCFVLIKNFRKLLFLWNHLGRLEETRRRVRVEIVAVKRAMMAIERIKMILMI
jgi:hypothetical protein